MMMAAWMRSLLRSRAAASSAAARSEASPSPLGMPRLLAAYSSSAANEDGGSRRRPKIVVVGGNGFVGSAVCEAAVARGAEVTSVSRSGTPALGRPVGARGDHHPAWAWVDEVRWEAGDAFRAKDWPDALLDGADGVVTCVGAFGSHAAMRRICGESNVAVVEAAHDRGVPRMAFISAHDFGFPLRSALRGYYEGKDMAEDAMFARFPGGSGAALRPGMIHGTRHVPLPPPVAGLLARGSLPVPLSLVGQPLRAAMAVLAPTPTASGVLVPPVSAAAVGRAAVSSVLDPPPAGGPDEGRIIDAWEILAMEP